MSEVTAQWWQWHLDNMPPTEGYYFIQSANASTRSIETYDTVPHTKQIVVPVINWISLSSRRDDSMLELARREIKDTIQTIKSNIPYKYIESDYFKLRDGRDAVSCGYWIVRQLDKGSHTIDTFGSCRNGTISLTQKHRIDVL